MSMSTMLGRNWPAIATSAMRRTQAQRHLPNPLQRVLDDAQRILVALGYRAIVACRGQLQVDLDRGQCQAEFFVQFQRHLAAVCLLHIVCPLRQRRELPCPVLQSHLGGVAVQGNLQCGAQPAIGKRLDDAAERLFQFCARQRVVGGEGGQEHDRHVVSGADGLRGGDAVHVARQAHVHQHQVGLQFTRHPYRLIAVHRVTHRLIRELGQLLQDVARNCHVVFDHQNSAQCSHWDSVEVASA